MNREFPDEVLGARAGETQRFIYTAYDNGVVTKTHKRTWEEIPAPVVIRLNRPYVMIGDTRFRIDKLIAEHFVPGYQHGMELIHVDGDNFNSKPSNLVPISLGDYFKLYRHVPQGRPIVVDGQQYNTIQEYANSVYVSPTTVRRYLKKGSSRLLGEKTIVAVRPGKKWSKNETSGVPRPAVNKRRRPPGLKNSTRQIY